MLTALLVVLFALMGAADVPKMVRRRQTKEMVAYACLWSAGLTLSLLVLYGVETAYVTKLLEAVFTPIGKRIIVPPPQ